jgi:hypothetical protein
MKALIVCLCIVLFIISSCTNSKLNNLTRKQNNIILSTGSFSFSPTIDSLLHLFIQKANCQDCYYEMYIDKKDENETLICLRASLEFPKEINENRELLNDYLKKRNPTLYTMIDGKIFFIYNGIEDLVIPISFVDKIELHKSSSSYFEYTWVIKKIKNNYNVYEETWVNPFEKNNFKGVIKFEIPQ